VLLAYYIACVNIENAFHDAAQQEEYKPFTGIALTDTFMGYDEGAAHKKVVLLDENSERIRRQRKKPITVIIGNPPYSAGQRSANDNAQNYQYGNLDRKIAQTYVALSDATNNRQVYDSYIRAFRYATDRLGDQDGIICFVSNGGWLDGRNMAGFRKTIENEFAKIYVFNLRGNQRTSGELSRKEGGKIFGSGSRTPVAITLLVKRAKHKGNAEIWYRDIGDYLSREEKLATIGRLGSFANPDMGLVRLEPNEHGDWITGRNEAFQTFISLAAEKKFDANTESAFVVHSNGIVSSRDAWVYNFSKSELLKNIGSMVDFYNSQLGKVEIENDPRKISWSRGLKSHREKNKRLALEKEKGSLAIYRPFEKQWLYRGERIVEYPSQWGIFFPLPDTDNRVLCVSGVSETKNFSCLITDKITEYHCLGGMTQCFPLYWYEEASDDGPLLGKGNNKGGYVRRDGVSDYILGEANKKYGGDVTKEDIFYYVYGILHHPKYRETFADDLKKALPRIPLVGSGEDFWAFSKAGRELAKLHLDYEAVPPPRDVTVTGNRTNLRVDKMKFPSKDQKDTIKYNSAVTISNIPPEAYEYIVNGKSAIEWVMERYQIKEDKESKIVNDPNLYSEEAGKPDYILNLLLSVITVSLRTDEIVKSLPEINF